MLSSTTKFYAITAVLLYGNLNWIVSELIQDLFNQILPTPITLSKLKDWRRQFEQIVQLVDDINRTFGSIVFIFISYTMASFSIVSFHLIVEYDGVFSTWSNTQDFIILIQHSIHLAVLTFFPHIIKHRVDLIQNYHIELILLNEFNNFEYVD